MVRALEVAMDVVVRSGEGLEAQLELGAHRLVADEPKELGGGGQGPNPYDLLLGALGACTSMTLRLYARTKGWPLESVTVRLRHQKVHAADCSDCETCVGKVDEIDVEIALAGPLDEAQRARLLAIAEKCPLHRTLDAELRMRTRLA